MIVEGLIRPASIQTSDRKRNQSEGYFLLFFFTGFFWAALMWVCCFGHTSPKQVELHLPRPADDRRHRRCENRPLIQCAISLMDNLSAEHWWIRLRYFIPASILFVLVCCFRSPLEHTSLRCCFNMSKQDGWLRMRECYSVKYLMLYSEFARVLPPQWHNCEIPCSKINIYYT